MTSVGTHIGELALRRLRAGEVVGGEVESHTGACAECRARLRALDDEQRRFEQEISFDRFAAGVGRAARSGAPRPRAVRPWLFSVVAMAAGVALMVTFTPTQRVRTSRTKGDSGAAITVRVAGSGPQRTAAVSAPERLAPGERVMIGYEPGSHRYLIALSVDDRGEVTPIYPEAGRSLPLNKAAAGIRYLPDGVVFTGTGAERLIVVFSDRPLEVDAARRAARAAFEKAKGDIIHLPVLELPGEQLSRTFIKP